VLEHRDRKDETDNGEAMLNTLQIYEPQPLRHEPIQFVVVPDEPEPRSYDLSTRKGRALLGADIKRGVVDLRDKPVAWIAKALCASARSMHQALRLSVDELDDVHANRRPLFEPRPAAQPPVVGTPIERLRALIEEVGSERALSMLVEIETAKQRQAA
jgi:hypothetical protein